MYVGISLIIDFLICKLKIYLIEEFEDTKGLIRVRKSKWDRQQNGQKKKDKRTNNDLQSIVTPTPLRAEVNSDASKG